MSLRMPGLAIAIRTPNARAPPPVEFPGETTAKTGWPASLGWTP